MVAIEADDFRLIFDFSPVSVSSMYFSHESAKSAQISLSVLSACKTGVHRTLVVSWLSAYACLLMLVCLSACLLVLLVCLCKCNKHSSMTMRKSNSGESLTDTGEREQG